MFSTTLFNVKKGKDNEATLSYLTKGLTTWIPSYSLELDNKGGNSKTLEFEGKMCLVCDLLFLEGDQVIPEVSLVSEGPNIVNRDRADPLVVNSSSIDYINKLAKNTSCVGSAVRVGRQLPGRLLCSVISNMRRHQLTLSVRPKTKHKS